MCRLYGDDEEFIFEGSGGPSMNITANKGGHGGGLISFEVEQIFILQGNITAVGEKPTFNTTSGGGSGGSVQIITTKLIGNGTININGGNGTIRQSGGGGGGKASIFFRQSHNMSYYPSMTELWHGQIKRRGGHGYAETEREFNEDYDGYEGILFTTKCQAGYSGASPYLIIPF